MRDVILLDLDHTLSDSSWRDHLAPDWDAYHAELGKDAPIPLVVDLVKALRPTYQVIALTARPEKYRMVTNDWFLDHNITVDGLLMRPHGNLAPARIVKLDLTEHLLDRVAFLIDDLDEVCATFHERGIHTLQIRTHRSTA